MGSFSKKNSSAPLVTSPTLAEGRSGEATELEMISTLTDLMVSPHHIWHFGCWMMYLVFGNVYLERNPQYGQLLSDGIGDRVKQNQW